MAGDGCGDFLHSREEKVEKEGLSRPVPLEDADETSDVSPSLFKEMTSEEEMEEVASGTQNQFSVGKVGNSDREIPDADTEEDSSGEDGSLFEGIDGDDERQYARHHSGYVGTSNRGSGACHEIYGLEDGIIDEVPFIRTGRRDLDDIGSLESPLCLLRGKEDGCVDNLVSKVEKGENGSGGNTKEELSLLVGISRDYGTSSGGEEGGEDGGLIPLAADNVAQDQNKTLDVRLNQPIQSEESVWFEKETTMALRTDCISGEDNRSTPNPMQLNEVLVSGTYEMLDGQNRAFTDDIPKGHIRKRGRAARELGALLMDSNAGRRGKRAFEFQQARTVVCGQVSAGESTDVFAASDGMGMSSVGLGSMGEVRITRSHVSSRSAVKDDNLGWKVPGARGPSDIAAKRTGKRSVTRGGRLGWGNGSESSQQSAEVVPLVKGNSSALGESVVDDHCAGIGLPPSVHVDEETAKSKPKRKSVGRAKKAKQGKAGCVDISAEGRLDSREIVPCSLSISQAQDVDESEVVINQEKGFCASASVECGLQDAVCSLNSQETEVLDVETITENNSLGRRRSNRHAAKAGQKVEVVQPGSCNGELQKNSRSRKRASTSGGNKVEEGSNEKFLEDQSVKNGEEISEPLSTPEEIAITVGNSGNDARAHAFSPLGGTGRKPAKGKRNADTVCLGRKKKASTVSGRPPNVRRMKGGGRSKVKQDDVELALVGLVNQGSACVTGVTLTGVDSAGVDQRTDKNTSSVTGDTNEVRQEQKDKEGATVFKGTLQRRQSCWSKPDAKDGCGRDMETCNSLACMESVEKFTEESSGNVMRSPLSVKLSCDVRCDEDATIVGVGLGQKVAANCQKGPSLQCNDGNTEGHGSRALGDDAGSATSCHSLVKKEGEAIGQGFTPDIALPCSGGCGDLEITETAELAKLGEVTGCGKARTRQRRVTQQQAGAKLSAQPSRKGKKGKKDSAVGVSVSQEKVVSSVNRSRKVGARKDKKKSVLLTGEKDFLDGNKEVDMAVIRKTADYLGMAEFDVHKEALEIHVEQVSCKEEGKLACPGSEVDATKRRKIGVSSEGCLASKPSSPLELLPGKGKSSSEVHVLAGDEASRDIKREREKKSITSLVTGLDAIASGAKSKNDSRRSSRAKEPSRIKALLSIKDQTDGGAPAYSPDELIDPVSGSHAVQPGGSTPHFAVKGQTSEPIVETISPSDADATDGREAVQDSVNVDSGKGPQGLEKVDSPDDGGAVGEDMSSGVTEGDGTEENERRGAAGVAEAGIPRKSWVLCDDCNKWRCIPVELADQIEDTNAKWSCRDNPNPDYADCSIPQEKSNAEINAELQLSEVSATEEGDDKDGIESKLVEIGTGSGENKPAVWKLIRRNIFQHRRAKSQASDEIMVCQCTPPKDGGVGCVDNCLNRVLNIECVQEHCPCGEACSNQQFQKRMYAPVATFRCGKKGFGLKVLKNIPKDSFLIEYVGEVLDVGAFEERQQEYARNGQKHFYFMTLSSTEVIDACSKGNFGRFINHSCEPNCKTEKWMVNGEVCIGLFAVRDIAEGEEVTFDYNYVRVRGASAKKCECGSPQCRGFIGADSETPRAVAESDSEEEEDPEPIMVVNSDEEDNHVDENKVTPLKKPKDDAVYRESTSTRSSRIKRKLVPVKDKGSAAVKRVKTSGTGRKIGALNSKGLTVDVGVGRHEGGRALSSDVQEKLDDLLDKRGGLKKRKDVVAQYLKLLVLSVASGDNKNDASACSVRDVSLLLEALLRTSSRSVLSDIMKMNGLRMLHTFIKQLRKQWDKTPILRKLMKVLELLTSDRVRVLTQSMINSAAPGRGMESFSESLFELTRHRDPEVCQMARRFRNKWVPPRPPVYEQYNRGADKPPQVPLKSVSPVQMTSSNKTQLDGYPVSSPPKQSPTGAALKGTEVSNMINGSSGLFGSLGGPASTQSQSGSVVTDETTTTRLCQGEVSLQSGPAPETGKAENVKRKRVSRWDAPSKIEKGTYEPIVGASSANVPAADSVPSSRQTSVPPASQMHATGAQFQFQESREQFNKKQRQFGPTYDSVNRGQPFRHDVPVGGISANQGAEEISGTSSLQPANMPPLGAWQQNFPGPSASLPSATSSGIQDPTRLAYGVTTGQAQLHSGCASGFPQRRPEPPGYAIPGQSQVPQAPGSLSLPPANPLSGPPPMISSGAVALHPCLQQVSPANGCPLGGLPVPGSVYPGCPPPHMGVGGPTLLHGMTPNMPMGYSQGVHYVQWGPPGMPHFAGPPAFPLDGGRRYIPQPTWPSNTGLYSEDASLRTSTNRVVLPSNGDMPASSLQSAGGMEPEPPVPGLSPPASTTCESGGVATSCPRETSKEPRMPPDCPDPRRCGESYISNEVPEARREREPGPDYYTNGIPDNRDAGSGFREEHWDDPESQSFRDHVYLLVRTRVRRHKLRTRDVDKFCTKLADVIVRKEVAKYLEQRNQGCEKIIVRSKLVEKVETYVDNQVEQFSRKCDRSYKSGDHAR